MPYCSKTELAAELKKSQDSGELTDRFVELANLIFSGMISTLSKPGSNYALDAVQNAWTSLLRSFHRLDANQNVFSYLSCIAKCECYQLTKRKKKHIPNFTDIPDVKLDNAKPKMCDKDWGIEVDDSISYERVGRKKKITYQGQTKSIFEWSQHLNMNYSTLKKRIQQWNDIPDAFTRPLRKVTVPTTRRKRKDH